MINLSEMTPNHWRLFGVISPREARAAFILAFIVITILALMPGPLGQFTWLGWDKLNHMAAFAALTVLMRCGFPTIGRTGLAVILMAYGLAIELLQSTALIGRGFSIADGVADFLGIVLGLVLSWCGAQVLERTPFLVRAASDD